jgi:putative transposase
MRGFRHWRWHLDEVYVKIKGASHYLWRASTTKGKFLKAS